MGVCSLSRLRTIIVTTWSFSGPSGWLASTTGKTWRRWQLLFGPLYGVNWSKSKEVVSGCPIVLCGIFNRRYVYNIVKNMPRYVKIWVLDKYSLLCWYWTKSKEQNKFEGLRKVEGAGQLKVLENQMLICLTLYYMTMEEIFADNAESLPITTAQNWEKSTQPKINYLEATSLVKRRAWCSLVSNLITPHSFRTLLGVIDRSGMV